MTRPEFSVVIATRGRPDRLARCLDDLGRLTGPEFELVIVDNTSGDASVRRAADEFGARYVVEPRAGLSRARNAGAAEARGRYVAFTDDDAAPHPDWLERHLAVLEGDGRPDVTTGRVLPLAADGAPGITCAEDLGTAAFRIDRDHPRWFERVNFGGVGVGANMVFRRELFDGALRFRESLGPSDGTPGEEHYAFFDVVRNGGAIEYVPDAVVEHDPLPSMEAAAQRYRGILRGSAAYALLLFVEEPQGRPAIIRYAVRAMVRRRQPWRQPGVGLLSRSQKFVAALHGPVDYLRWRRRWGGS